MARLPDFQRRQYEFAAHIRDPENKAAPAGIEDRRMAVYRDLFFNNLRNLLGSTFPVLKRLSGRDRWGALIREFMARHQSQTPYFLEIPKEFLAFLEHEHEPTADDFPFLLELAHYEWVELALSISTDHDDLTSIDPAGNMLESVPVMSVLAWPLAYRYPVHRISERFQPAEPGGQPTYLAIYRNAENDISFMELNAVTAALLDKISNNTGQKSGRELLIELSDEIDFDPDALIKHGASALAELRAANILLGTSSGESS
jgi:hypothetical protein